MSISTVIITKNEGECIAKCINSVLEFSDEVIVVDDFSTDNTPSVVLTYEKVNLYQRKFDGYINQKNYANTLATSSHIFSIDADEWCSNELITYFKEFKNRLPQALSILRINMIGDKEVRNGLWGNDRKIRLWEKELGKWSGSTPHEDLVLSQGVKEVVQNDSILYHSSVKNLSEYYRKSIKYAVMASAELSKKSYFSLFLKLLLNPAFKFIKSYYIKGGYKDGWNGFGIAAIAKIETFVKYLLAIMWKLGLYK